MSWDRLIPHFRVGDGCWEWTSFTNGSHRWQGYGKVTLGPGRYVYAHRAVYEELRGPIPEGLELDHLCRNHACVNPWHLEPVTHRENMRRSVLGSVTECVNGHPFDDANTYTRKGGGRVCKACRADRMRRYGAVRRSK